jgi:hypothetical protein
MRKQTAIYWPKATETPSFDAFGNPSTDGPTPIKCRWEDVCVEFIGPDGTREQSKAVVYVDRLMTPGDLLLLAPGYDGAAGGPLGPIGNVTSISTFGLFISDIPTPTDPEMADYAVDDPKDELGAWEVRQFASFPNLRVTEFLMEAYL